MRISKHRSDYCQEHGKMNRLYERVGTVINSVFHGTKYTMRPVGYYCRLCNRVTLDHITVTGPENVNASAGQSVNTHGYLIINLDPSCTKDQYIAGRIFAPNPKAAIEKLKSKDPDGWGKEDLGVNLFYEFPGGPDQ